ncbi:tRNA (guanosine(46)-N7)-methyltransferase TrmB [Alkaliphilus transvaalensis]|uniref:tRNA (guanosine(46)-N7)-methyltransferase TrmB n=1 Tax=Alkaliphilus transvaalensis TaxID=114628 RepID=UPI00047AFECE|nr:tRNA (guanosine(46)-N7)-methyltransferase TrmB [Alkaliphilus transvaalensis]
MRVRNIPGVEELLKTSSNYIDLTNNVSVKWNEIFQNEQPIHIEIGMGKGQFLTTLAEKNPTINYVGIEKSKELLWKVCKLLEGKGINNIRIINQKAEELDNVFRVGEIEGIYLNFSDPWPKARHDKRRLTHRGFLKKYQGLLKENGEIHFKTDSLSLFEFSLEEFKNTKEFELIEVNYDLHKTPPIDNVMTEYEEKFVKMGKPIYKCIAKVKK